MAEQSAGIGKIGAQGENSAKMPIAHEGARVEHRGPWKEA